MHEVLYCQYYLLYSVKYAWSFVWPWLCILQVLITWNKLILSLKLYNPPHKIYPPKTLTIIISMNLIILLNCWKKIESFTFLKFENPSSGSEIRGCCFSTPPYSLWKCFLSQRALRGSLHFNPNFWTPGGFFNLKKRKGSKFFLENGDQFC